MAKNKIEKDPTILEAVDTLSSIAELDVNEILVSKKTKQTGVNALRWLDPLDERKTVDSIKTNLKVILTYLKHIHTKEVEQLEDESTQKGISSIIKLAQEAVSKIDEYAKQCKKQIHIADSKEYISLIEFYQKNIESRFEKKSENEEVEIDSFDDRDDISRRGLKDLESVKKDDDYELFYLQKEDGGKFYHPNLARHIRLVADFDQIISKFSIFDPLIKIPLLKDDVAFHLCKQMRDRLKIELDEVIKTTGKHRDDPLVQNVFRGIMALFLSSNAKNQLKITTGKSVSAYFKDFQINIRAALSSIDYRNYIDCPPKDEFYINVLNLLHMMCFVMYTSHINTKESGSLLSLMSRSEKEGAKKNTCSSVVFCNELLDKHETFSKVFKACPNGPLFKILDIMNEEGVISEFDPILQGDFPGNYFYMKCKSMATQFLKIPSPTIQSNIEEANISFEFKAFLRALVLKQEKILLINFQDKTSWKEYARAHVIELTALDAEFQHNLVVVSFPKSTDFYNQCEEYLNIDDAEDFKKVFLKQIESEEACGFLFPKSIDRALFFPFVKMMINEIHKTFFSNRKTLSQKNRLDFIEIGYHLMYLYFIKEVRAEYTAFLAKDGVDVSAITIGSMFGFLKTLTSEIEWKVEDQDFLVETIYSSALIVRERAPQINTLNRAVSMLSVVTAELELDKKKISKISKDLFENFFSSMSVSQTI